MQTRLNRSGRFVTCFIILLTATLQAAYSEYPQIKSLNNDDLLFRQLQSEIEGYYTMSKKNPLGVAEVTIYTYGPKRDADLYSIAASANIPYDTLVTINRACNPEAFKALKNVLIPSVPGIFVPLAPKNDLEEIMSSWRLDRGDKYMIVSINTEGVAQKFAFFQGARFSNVERAFFLDIFFRFPLPFGKVSSEFGTRESPFSGHPEVHSGIDIAAPKGTEVYAVREGIVTKTGFDPTYGNYILLTHPGDYQSFYGHLDVVFAATGQSVSSGILIGKVGTTGRSTGPHLHFEIRKKGVAIDPETLIKHTDISTK